MFLVQNRLGLQKKPKLYIIDNFTVALYKHKISYLKDRLFMHELSL